MATNAENITLMMGRLGGRSSPPLRLIVLAELNKQIRELERGATRPWFMESRLDGNLTANQDYIAIPATFLDEIEEGTFRLYNTQCLKWIPLRKLDYDQLQYKSENCAAAFPEYYAMKGDRVYFGATPDAGYAYRWEAFVRSTPVIDNAVESSNPWLLEFFDLVSLITIDRVARLHIRSAEIIDAVRQPLADARDAFWRNVEARQQSNRDYQQQPED